MFKTPSMLLAVLLVLAFGPAGRAAENLGIRVPADFEITRYADDSLAHDIYSITTDARGRIVVAGPGYVKILLDNDKDGRADATTLYSSKPAGGAQGMCFDGPNLITTGDNKVMRQFDDDGDDRADREETWTELVTSGEHGAHNIVRGPDGWYYIACGNDAKVSKKHVTTKTSPVKEPLVGAIVRISPDGKQSEVFADGFRNPYGLDFNAEGHLFTVDSDNERDQHLPWYCPTRLFDVAQGQSHGWVNEGWQNGWNKPESFPDSVERLVEIGRGSPTGVLCYRHKAWPARYQQGVFSACWTLGRIYFFPLVGKGASYSGKQEIFLEGEGATGLAIVGMTVDPAGDMYFAVGGRKTQGSVYRVRYVGKEPAGTRATDAAKRPESVGSALRGVPEPRNESGPVEKSFAASTDGSMYRMSQKELVAAVRELWDKVSDVVAQQGLAGEVGRSRISAIRLAQIAAGDVPNRQAKPELFVGYSPAIPGLDAKAAKKLIANIASQFPFNAAETNREIARLLAMLESDNAELRDELTKLITKDTLPQDDIHYLICLARMPGERSSEVTTRTATALVNLHVKMNARSWIPSRNWPLRVGELFEELVKKDVKLIDAVLKEPAFGLPEHSLFVTKLTGDNQRRAARQLLTAVTKSDADWNTDLIAALKFLPGDELRPALRKHWDEPALRDSIALILADKPAAEDRQRFVESLGSVQSNVVRAAAVGLAKLAIDGKTSADSVVEISAALTALRQQCQAPNERATRQALSGLLGRLTGQSIEIDEPASTKNVAATKNMTAVEIGKLYRPWFDWFAKAHPAEYAKLGGSSVDVDTFYNRLATIDWSKADATRGKAAFEKRSCHRCHGGAGRLGPELAGAATRFSREDLFAAIVDPNKEIAPLYRTTSVVNDRGEVYNGLIVYESPDGTLLQTGPDTTVRVMGVTKDGMQKSNVSLMPTGLLNDARDQELSDLYEYLRTLK